LPEPTPQPVVLNGMPQSEVCFGNLQVISLGRSDLARMKKELSQLFVHSVRLKMNDCIFGLVRDHDLDAINM
jgi:hypothetical protein